MELIVAVYDDWGIGAGGTQPVALSADRKFFRETTKGACVIAGRKTLGDFPGGKPLPNRVNVVISRGEVNMEGVIVCHSPEEAAEVTRQYPRVMVIGGGSIYRQMLPFCDTAYITKVHACPESDTFFPNLDEDPQWEIAQELLSGEEDGIRYEMCLYKRK
ncbi:MAG: dihydrofolate reductase [Oscillospiraceae bacterium]|nr:dihydrofolate reductase [Oscillospiraceae bacterium]